ncbi:MAG: YcxB family protein [Actinomycetota bacterium]|jgi:hypothetical protein|nr:YcxB family protein [Actinomycetota bacterium]
MSDLTFSVALSRKGYRRVLTRLAYERLRFAVPLLGAIGLFSSASGATRAGLLSFAALLGLPIAIYGLVSWQVYRPGRSPIFAHLEYRTTDEGLVFGPRGSLRIVEWGEFKRWREVADHVLLFVKGSQYVLIPTHSLTPDERDDLISLLTVYIGSPKDRSLIGRFRRRSR